MRGFFLSLFVLGGVLLAPQAQAEFRLVTGYLPPWSMTNNKTHPGFFIEIMKEAQNRLGYDQPIETYPWGRAQNIAQNQPDVLIFPLARLKTRENKYSWIIPIRKMEMSFISNHHRNLDEATAKKLNKVLVHKDSPPEMVLQSRGFDNLVNIHDITPKIPKMMAVGRADAWFTPLDMAQWIWKQTPEFPMPYISEPVTTDLMYIAGSKELPVSLIKQFNRVLSDMKKEGTIDKIIQRYQP